MGDVEGLVRLSARLFVEDAGGRDPDTDTSWPARRGREHFLGLLSREDAVCLLALSDGTKVGYLAGYVREKTAIRPVTVAGLQSMYVEEGERGSGVGARLVGKFFAWAGGLGVERASVTAHAANGDAIRFYRRLGSSDRGLSLERGLRGGPPGVSQADRGARWALPARQALKRARIWGAIKIEL